MRVQRVTHRLPQHTVIHTSSHISGRSWAVCFHLTTPPSLSYHFTKVHQIPDINWDISLVNRVQAYILAAHSEHIPESAFNASVCRFFKIWPVLFYSRCKITGEDVESRAKRGWWGAVVRRLGFYGIQSNLAEPSLMSGSSLLSQNILESVHRPT